MIRYLKIFIIFVMLLLVNLVYHLYLKNIKFMKLQNEITLSNINNENSKPLRMRLQVTKNSTNQRGHGNNGTTTKNPMLKYILQWTSPKKVPFIYMKAGQEAFIDANCTYTNCYVTPHKNYLRDYTKFDAIVFAGPEVLDYQELTRLPRKRSSHQKYVFASIESSDNYPVCSKMFNGFFNWTWTYKLNSDARWGYMVIRDSKKTIVGPKRDMHWIKPENMNPVSSEMKMALKKKWIAAAWFVSNCETRSLRERFVNRLDKELKKYDLDLDIYGPCGAFACGKKEKDRCHSKISNDYFFYLAFENAFSEDYVTEKLLHAVQHNAVPIVYGGANYSRFMPEGSYLNAFELGAPLLAAKMKELIQDIDKYAKFFKWKNHYSYHQKNDHPETNDYCEFCALLNNEKEVKHKTIYTKFREWWDPPYRCLSIL